MLSLCFVFLHMKWIERIKSITKKKPKLPLPSLSPFLFPFLLRLLIKEHSLDSIRLEHIVCNTHFLEDTPFFNLIDTTLLIGRLLDWGFTARGDAANLFFRLHHITEGGHLSNTAPCWRQPLSFMPSRWDRFFYNLSGRGGGGGSVGGGGGDAVFNSRCRLSGGRVDYNNRVIVRSRRAVKVLRMSYRLGIGADLEITDVNLVVKGVLLREGVEKALKVWPARVGIIRRIQVKLCLHCEIDEEGWFFGRRGGGEVERLVLKAVTSSEGGEKGKGFKIKKERKEERKNKTYSSPRMSLEAWCRRLKEVRWIEWSARPTGRPFLHSVGNNYPRMLWRLPASRPSQVWVSQTSPICWHLLQRPIRRKNTCFSFLSKRGFLFLDREMDDNLKSNQ